MCPTPGAVHPESFQIGQSEGSGVYAPQGPRLGGVVHPETAPPTHTLQDPGKGRRVVQQGPGAEINGSAWGGGARERRLRPPPPPEGKGRWWPARTEPDAATRTAGAAGRGPGGTERVGAG